MREAPTQDLGLVRDAAAWQTIDNELPSKEAADRIIKMRKHGNTVVRPSPLFETLELRTVESDILGLWAIEARLDRLAAAEKAREFLSAPEKKAAPHA